MSHVPKVLKSDRSVFDEMLPVDDNGSIFCQIFYVFFRLYTPFPPLDPRSPLHMLYICIAPFNCPKGILGLEGGGEGGG